MKYLVVILFLLCNHAFMQEIIITEHNNFKNIEIVYNLPDFLNPKLNIYSDSTKMKLVNSFETKHVLKPSKKLKETDWNKEWKMDGRPPRVAKKQIVDVIQLNSYFIITAAELESWHKPYDVLIWKNFKGKFILVSHYPEFIGGCLYCRIRFIEINKDTLTFNISGTDEGSIWGSKEKYVLKEDQLYKIFIQKIEGFTYEEKDNIRYNRFFKNYYYNENGEYTKSSIDCIYKINGRDQYAYSKTDSLKLFLVTADYMPYRPKLVKTVSLKNDSIRIGKFISGKVTVLWEDEWYITYTKYLKFKK